MTRTPLAPPRPTRAALALAAGLALGCGDAFAPNVGDLVVDSGGATDARDAATDAPKISFGKDIRPLMNRSNTDDTGHGCKQCHYSTEPNHVGLDLAGLDLSTLGRLRKGGGTSGKGIVVPFDSKGSAIVQKLKGTYAFGTRMPKDGPAFWRDEDIQKVVDWIDQGAEGADDE
jgi:hypothetical protein